MDKNDAVSRQSKILQYRDWLGSYLTRYGLFSVPSLPDSSVKPIRFTSAMALGLLIRFLSLRLDGEEVKCLSAEQLWLYDII
jgi:hypothetical protein